MKYSAILPALLSIAFAGTLHASLQSDIGYTELKQQFGSTLPDGANVSVLMVEAPDSAGNWAVAKSGELSTRKITFPMSTTTPTAYSAHANLVAKNLTGVTTSILPGLGELQVASISTYRSRSIHMATLTSPEPATWDVENHSLISNVTTYNLNALWLLDYRIARDNVTVVIALENGTNPMKPLWGNNYNTIAVGTATGLHNRGGTNLDGSGRMKPDLVGTATYTSYATPVVTSAAGLLIAESKRTPSLAVAKDARTVKALLMAGATKEEFPAWSHTASQPLDPIYGAGQVNIYNSYVALVSGRVTAGSTMDTTAGWDLGTSAKNDASYRFSVPAGQTLKFSTALCWYRELTTSNYWVFDSSLADLNLRLRNTDTGAVVSESTSTLDNVEHIYVAALPAGNYTLDVVGPAGTTYGLAWYGTLSGGTAEPVVTAPAIAIQPVSLNVNEGQVASFSVVATGDSLSYQWCHDGATISGATSSTYSIATTSTSCAGNYCVNVTNSAGSVTSNEVALTVNSVTTNVSESTSGATTSPSTISARGENAPNELAANLTDGKTTTKWLDFSANTWVRVELPEAASLSSYSLTSANDYYQRDPYTWTVSGSNDGVNWTVVDSRSAEIFATRYLQRDFQLATASAAYRFFRFDITCRSGSITQLAELALHTGAATTTEPPATETVDNGGTTESTIAELAPIASSARGENAPREVVANLFDHNTGTKWLDFSANTWVQVELAEATPLSSYSLTSANDYYQRDPYTWTVSGSNDGVNWTVVDSRSAEIFATRLLQRDFVLDQASAAYRFYRFDITCRSATITQLAELEIWGGTVVASETTAPVVDQTSEATLVEFTPVAIAVRGENAPREVATNLFDGNTATKWLDFSGNTWIQVELDQARQLESYSLTSANDYYQRDPYTWTVYGSNDGVTWTAVDSRSAEIFATRYLQRDFVLSQASAAYRFFRFEITARSASITQLAELELWGR